MDRKRQVRNIFVGLLRAMLCLLSFGLLLAAFAGGVLKFSLFDREFFRWEIANEEYCKKITEFIREDAELDCDIYQMPFSVVEAELGEEKVTEQCRLYIDAFYDALYEGRDKITVEFPREGLYNAVYNYFVGEGTEASRAADDAEYISVELGKRAEENICALTEQRFISLLSQFVFSVPLLHKIADLFFWAAGLAVVLLVLLLLFGGKTFAVRLYVTGGVIFVASSVVFVPVWLLRMYNVPSKLVLAASPMKSLFESFWYSLEDRMFYISLGGFIISAALLVGAVVFIVCSKYRRTKAENAETEEIEEPVPVTEE